MARNTALNPPRSTLPSFTRSPVTQVELRYQQRGALPHRRSLRRWIAWGMYGLALVGAMIFYWGEFVGAVLWRDTRPIFDTLPALEVYVFIYAIADFFVLILRALSAGANSITREKQTGTWDTLLLTGIDSRQIVRGKWWAIFRSMMRPALLVIPLRLGMVAIITAELTRPSLYFYYTYGGYQVVPPNPLGVLLVIPLITAFTFAAVALASAVGVMASALLKRPVYALSVGAVLYIVLVILTVVGLILTLIFSSRIFNFNVDYYDFYIVVSGIIQAVAITVIENGTMLAAVLMSYHADYAAFGMDTQWRDRLVYLGAFAGMIVLFPLAIWSFLRLAQRFVARDGALPPLRRVKR